MQVFSSTVNQMLVLVAFVSLGFVLNKIKFLPKETANVISKLESFVLGPALAFSNFCKNFTVQNISQKWHYVLYSSVIVIISFVIALVLAKFFEKDKYLKNLYAYSFTASNFGFMGQAVVLGVFGEEGLFGYLIFCIPLYVFVYSFGIAMLIPTKTQNESMLKKFVNPNFILMLCGALIGLLKIPTPKFITDVASSLGACMAPLAMILTGVIVAEHSVKKLAMVKKIYLASIIRLVFIPLFFYGILTLLKTDSEVIKFTLCATAMPLGLNTIVFPAAYNEDTTVGASMALISHVMSVITIPLMFLLI